VARETTNANDQTRLPCTGEFEALVSPEETVMRGS
jgi:hypothetical protein